MRRWPSQGQRLEKSANDRKYGKRTRSVAGRGVDSRRASFRAGSCASPFRPCRGGLASGMSFVCAERGLEPYESCPRTACRAEPAARLYTSTWPTAISPARPEPGCAFATTSHRQNGLAIRGQRTFVSWCRVFAATGSTPVKTHRPVRRRGLRRRYRRAPPRKLVHRARRPADRSAASPRRSTTWTLPGAVRLLLPGVIPDRRSASGGRHGHWDAARTRITAALIASRQGTELMRVRRRFDPPNPATIVNTTVNVLWHNVFGFNDASAKLGGNPFGNRFR